MKTTRKNGRCPTCSPDGPHAIFTSETVYDEAADSFSRVWRCNCCLKTHPRREHRRRSDVRTPSQVREVERQIRYWGMPDANEFWPDAGGKVYLSWRNTMRAVTIGRTGKVKVVA